jgi:hypothetical protein
MLILRQRSTFWKFESSDLARAEKHINACNECRLGTMLNSCVDVANTALVPIAMPMCALFAHPHSRLTA